MLAVTSEYRHHIQDLSRLKHLRGNGTGVQRRFIETCILSLWVLNMVIISHVLDTAVAR